MSNHLTDEQLINYAYRTLSDTQREMTDFHLTRCPQCRARLAEHETLQRRIRYSIMDRHRQTSPSAQMTFAAIAPRLKRSRRLIMFWKQSNQILYGAVTIVVLVILAVGLIALLGNIGINLPLTTTEGNEVDRINLTTATSEMFAETEIQTQGEEPLPTSAGQTPASQPATYVVQPGDTLPTIAEKFGISIEDLIAENPNLGLLQAGQELIISGEKPTPSTTPPPPTGKTDVSFGYGIQTDPRGDTEANIEHIKTLGFEWVKFQMPWKEVEPAPGGNYIWMMWDEVIDAYASNDVKIMLSIVKAPDWARPADDDKSIEGLPANPANYANFVAQVAARYQGKVQAIEIWNEQNLWYETGGKGRIDPAAYVPLLQQAYQIIKSVNPNMIVISGGPSPAGNVGDPDQGGNLAIDDIEYLGQMYAHGAKGYFDALGAHPSGFNCPALADWQTFEDPTATNFRGLFEHRHHSWCFLGTMEGYREVMVANGDGDTPITPTEFGWGVSSIPEPGYEYTRDNTYEEQAQWIVEAYQWAKEQGWVGPMFLWNLDYGVTAPGTALGYFSILNTPAYDALVNMPK